MTGIVVVSHSRALADAAVRLAAEMATGSQVRVEVAAGLDENTLGTDATAIAAAIEAADDDGVVVLMDLGSAVLSAELALELVEPGLRDRVRLSPAPLVEGLVLAVVAAGGGAGPDGVCREAEGALRAKQEQIGTEAHAAVESLAAEPEEQSAERVTTEFTIDSPHGLHARPAARLVELAQRLRPALSLRNLTAGTGPAEASSMLGVSTLGAERGHRIELTATGSGAQEAVDAVLALAERNFDDA
jgi:phosphocarrier protein FPr